ncbi:hypothetical protein MKK88_30165 [Methylobacterium sp. E-005]|uniref:hypothetical protein n=1 Tax=Methylobacterium sp. E-005 TaxID=2836549 RepID=UPI001FB8FEE3|nr:hypothetical protein [Methylobacterium sp. E-005]MCJ2090219.1 hypothetical protein [Methylobacterium sp. E-005]
MARPHKLDRARLAPTGRHGGSRVERRLDHLDLALGRYAFAGRCLNQARLVAFSAAASDHESWRQR